MRNYKYYNLILNDIEDKFNKGIRVSCIILNLVIRYV